MDVVKLGAIVPKLRARQAPVPLWSTATVSQSSLHQVVALPKTQQASQAAVLMDGSAVQPPMEEVAVREVMDVAPVVLLRRAEVKAML